MPRNDTEHVLGVGISKPIPTACNAGVLPEVPEACVGSAVVLDDSMVIEDCCLTPDSPLSAASSPRTATTDPRSRPEVGTLMAMLMMQHSLAHDRGVGSSVPLTFARAREYKPSWKEVDDFRKNVLNIHGE